MSFGRKILDLVSARRERPKRIQAEETLRQALVAAPTIWEVLARPDRYAQWYNGQRKDALTGKG